MPNWEMYSTGHLQDFRAILTELEAEGITDPRFQRQRIDEIIVERFKGIQKRKIKINKTARKLGKIICPDCKKQIKYCKLTKAVHCECGWSRRIDI